jgi:Tripartite tricarboxylate transporter family receptor
MVVPFAAGGAFDVVGRILTPRLSELLGRQVVVENVSGAGGMTGVSRVAKASPDGYQFFLGDASTFAINQTFYKNPLWRSPSTTSPSYSSASCCSDNAVAGDFAVTARSRAAGIDPRLDCAHHDLRHGHASVPTPLRF